MAEAYANSPWVIVPREGELITIREITYRVSRVIWTLDEANVISVASLRSSVELAKLPWQPRLRQHAQENKGRIPMGLGAANTYAAMLSGKLSWKRQS